MNSSSPPPPPRSSFNLFVYICLQNTWGSSAAGCCITGPCTWTVRGTPYTWARCKYYSFLFVVSLPLFLSHNKMSRDGNPRDKKLRFIKAGAEAELVERSVYVPRNGFLWFSWLKFYTVRGEKEREGEGLVEGRRLIKFLGVTSNDWIIRVLKYISVHYTEIRDDNYRPRWLQTNYHSVSIALFRVFHFYILHVYFLYFLFHRSIFIPWPLYRNSMEGTISSLFIPGLKWKVTLRSRG